MAAVLDEVGGLLGTQSFRADSDGYSDLLAWFEAFGEVSKVGVEGTGSYGAGIARHLARAGVHVVEVDRQNRQARRHSGKSDLRRRRGRPSRALRPGPWNGQEQGRLGRGHPGPRRRQRSARAARIKALTQMRQLTFSAPDQLQSRLKGLPIDQFVAAARAAPNALARWCHRGNQGVALLVGPSRRRPRGRDRSLDAIITPLLEETAPELLGVYGVGIDTAPCARRRRGHPERLHSEAAWAHLCGVSPLEASSGKVTRHRLNRGGDRQANRALWHIVITRLASDPRTKPHRASGQRRSLQARGHPHAQAIRRPRGLSLLASPLDPRTMGLAHERLSSMRLTCSRYAGHGPGFNSEDA